MDNSSNFGRPTDQQQPQHQQQSPASASTSQIPSPLFNLPRRQPSTTPDRSKSASNSNTQFTSLNSSYSNEQSSFGPLKGNRSSLHAHRSSMYTRPNYSLNNNSLGLGPSASYISNRYFGNSSGASKSVTLGVKKSTEVNDLTPLQPELTPTAKRISQSLHTVSTPVLNKENRILGMESIKSLRPDLTSGSFKRKIPSSSGPPIHFSQSIPQPLPLKAARFENNNAREAAREPLEDDEYQFPDAWSFNDIENCVRNLPKQNIDAKHLMKLYEDKKKSEDNAAKSLTKSCTEVKTPVGTTGESKPANLPLATIAQDSKWECSVCMVYNKAEDSACVCCSEMNPNFPNAAKWDCSICLVKNKAQDSACVCCGEKNPKTALASGNSGDMKNNNEGNKSVGDFKFGFSTPAGGGAGGTGTATTTTTPPTSNFKFGDDKADKPAAPANFKFGFNAASASNQPKTEASTTPPGLFQSGPNKIGGDSQTQANNGPGFSFGLTAADTEKFRSGIKVQPLSGFRFGTTPARPSTANDKAATATKSSTEQTWRCAVCHDENNSMLSLKCRGCEATRTNLESTFKLDTNTTTRKDFSFQPYCGQRTEDSNTATVTSPNKRKAVPDTSEHNPDAPKLKLKSPSPDATSEIKSAADQTGFMDANKKEGGEDVPDTANKSETTGMPTTATATTTTAAVPTLGSTATTNSLNTSLATPVPLSTSTATTSAVVPNPFTFQATAGLPASTTTSQQPASASAAFGSSLSTATSASQQQPTTSSALSTSPGLTSAPTPSFSFGPPIPVFQFGQQQATSTPFVFGASATPAAPPAPAIATAPTTGPSSSFSFAQTTTPAAGGFGGFKPTFGQPPVFGQSASSNMTQPTPTFGSSSTTPVFNAGGNTGFNFSTPIQPAAPTTGALFGMPPIPTGNGNNLQQQAPGANPNMPLFNMGTSTTSERKPFKKAHRRLR